MKSILTVALLILMVSMGNAQNTLTLNFNAAGAAGSKLQKVTTDAEVQSFDPNKAINITVSNLPAGVVAVVRASLNGTAKTVTGASPNFALSALSADEIAKYKTYDIIVTDGNETVTIQNIAKKNIPGNNVTAEGNFPKTSALQELGLLFPSFEATAFGFKITSSRLAAYPYLGDQYSHIFLDQFGNSLLGAIPQGISNRQYIVHVFYLTNSVNQSQITYSVKQTKGSFSSALVFNNAGQIPNVGTQGADGTTPEIKFIWAHQEFLLRTATDDIEFEVSRNILETKELLNINSNMVAKHKIEMSKVFHGSFDVGLINTTLANPTFELLPSVDDPNKTVIKQSDKGNRGVVTAMATLYTSPIILIEKYLLGKNIPNYKLTGRNFLDDHKIWERIFPAIGVAISDKAFKNLFFGANWELARGASVFAGVHYGEVNTFNADVNFKFEQTVINEADFKLRQNKEWKHSFAIGANLDILIITNLFRTASAPAP
jgi:hypothetical protein